METVKVLHEAILGPQSGFNVSEDAALPTLGEKQQVLSQRNIKCDLKQGGRHGGNSLERTVNGHTATFAAITS